MSIKKQLLDPLGTLCKIITLNFNELNTKLSIHNHILSVQKPKNFQFVYRMINGDGRENISELFYIIYRIIKWYLIFIVSEGDEEENWYIIANSYEIKRLIKYGCIALRKLQETYEYGNVVLAIQYYINILEDALNNNFNDNKFPVNVMLKEQELENLLDYNKLKNFWDHKKLKRICELYDQCFCVYNDDEVVINEKIALIDGYLQSINSMLEMNDTEFQKLIYNSNKG